MLTQLDTVKNRLALAAGDPTYDDFLKQCIEAVSARIDRECNRSFARTVGVTQEFAARDKEVIARCYPIEAVTKFEVKTSEAGGWLEQVGVDCLVRERCVISLLFPLLPQLSILSLQRALGRVTYTGGFVLPGLNAGDGQTALPADLESAAVEQVAAWFQHRDKLGLLRYWPKDGVYLVFSQLPLLPQVSATLRPYQRWVV